MITRPNVKINLGLHVLRKREDGYHDLETLFVPYHGIYDVLEIISGDDYSQTLGVIAGYDRKCVAQAISPDGKLMITIARKEGVDWDPLKDLTAKAYFLLAEDFKLPPVKIFLEKLSPVGAGLGGGSADAAFALQMLSQLFGLNLPAATLAGYAARLGSDCPFFIYNTPMMGTGRGEVLTPFDLDSIIGPEYEIRVTVPQGISVSTADAYRGIVPREAAAPAQAAGHARPDRASLADILRTPVTAWKDSLINDFEATVFAKYPALEAIKNNLYKEGAVYASMSGSGSALFAIFRK
ncbi:MAG: 4-(cytidine 5'-diphospho)-2-C-methyl-D-erythritol kinase [Bacteroidota bacterium]|nr:4-(cytidine 5'-diphospho)-2-C-methyl-D-erythritol kinase [Bacteroidota bacterium]